MFQTTVNKDNQMLLGFKDPSKELADTKESLRAVTQKFATARKERDQLKTENKELQAEVMQLQHSMRQMVPCVSNTS